MAITSGDLKFGQKINESEVAAMLQISRSPLREAIAALAARGLIVKVANRGAFVVNYTLDDIEDICTFRQVLEAAAVEIVIDHPTPLELEAMGQVIQEMGYAMEFGDAEMVVSTLDLRFHAALMAAAHNKRLFDAWHNLRPHFQMLLYSRNVINGNFRESAVKGHLEILDALKARNGQLAKKLIEDHLDASYCCLHRAYSVSLSLVAGTTVQNA